MSKISVAVIQMSPSGDRENNLSHAATLLAESAERGATLAILPEMFSALVPAAQWRQTAERQGGAVEAFLTETARKHRMYIVGGSYVEAADGGRFFNTCPVFAPDGSVLGRYRKMHLFWTDIKGATRYDERSYLAAGDSQLVFNAAGFAVTVGICYDLRFPEFFRKPLGRVPDLCCLPAAFMHATGKAHWETLVKARAIENLAYFAAAGTVGRHYEVAGRPGEFVETWGHSMLVSPWGNAVAETADGEGVAVGEITHEAIVQARGKLAALDHMRDDLWRTRG